MTTRVRAEALVRAGRGPRARPGQRRHAGYPDTRVAGPRASGSPRSLRLSSGESLATFARARQSNIHKIDSSEHR